jgi:hypothetical protein
MDRQIYFDNNSNVLRFKLRRSDTGQGLTGLSSASVGLIISTICDVEAAATTYTVAGSTIETIATLGTYAAPTATKCRFAEVDATNHPGLYEFQFADARFSVANARMLSISAIGAANLLEREYEIELVRYDPQDSVRMGMTALPNAVPGTNGGLPTQNGTKLNQTVDLTAGQSIAASSIPNATIGGYAAGQDPVTLINLGVPDVNVKTESNHDFTALQKTSLNAATPSVSVDIGGIQNTSFAAGAIDAAALATDAANEIADAYLDRANAIEVGLTPRQAQRLEAAALAGKLSGAATTTVVIRNAVADSKNRITATVDSDGNRSAVAIDVS